MRTRIYVENWVFQGSFHVSKTVTEYVFDKVLDFKFVKMPNSEIIKSGIISAERV